MGFPVKNKLQHGAEYKYNPLKEIATIDKVITIFKNNVKYKSQYYCIILKAYKGF